MRVAIEVPRNIMDIVKLRAQQEHLDEKATLKQLLCMEGEMMEKRHQTLSSPSSTGTDEVQL
jgi:hypothetical protein